MQTSPTILRKNGINPLFWNSSDSATIRSQFFAVGNAINFRYWDIREGKVVALGGTKKGEGFRGALYMWRCLRICVAENLYPVLDAAFLANVTEGEFDAIFSTDDGYNPLCVGKDDRLANLRDFGSKLLSNWDGSFFNLVRACNGSLVIFSQLSRQFLAYDDPCLKLTMVNAILHSGSNLIDFDAEPLPGIDYQLLKQLLRIGVLLPERSLSTKLKNKEILTSY